MGSAGTVSVVALTPTVECGTSSYWMWNIFYGFILLFAIFVIVFVWFATLKARRERDQAMHGSFLGRLEQRESTGYIPRTIVETLGSVWSSPFGDSTPWWTSVDLLVRLLLIGAFALTITRYPDFTPILLIVIVIG